MRIGIALEVPKGMTEEEAEQLITTTICVYRADLVQTIGQSAQAGNMERGGEAQSQLRLAETVKVIPRAVFE